MHVWSLYSHHVVFECENGPEARVCPPCWTEEPAARVENIPSLVGSEEGKTTTIISTTVAAVLPQQFTRRLFKKDLFKAVKSDHRGAQNSCLGANRNTTADKLNMRNVSRGNLMV